MYLMQEQDCKGIWTSTMCLTMLFNVSQHTPQRRAPTSRQTKFTRPLYIRALWEVSCPPCQDTSWIGRSGTRWGTPPGVKSKKHWVLMERASNCKATCSLLLPRKNNTCYRSPQCFSLKLINTMIDTLPIPANLQRWKYRSSVGCKLCGNKGTTNHIFKGNKGFFFYAFPQI